MCKLIGNFVFFVYNTLNGICFVNVSIIIKRGIMKIVCVVDSINEIKSKINLIKSYFGDNICYVVKATLVPIFKTFGNSVNAIYNNNLTTVIHAMLQKSSQENVDVLVYYTSLKINDNLLNKFNSKIKMHDAVVSLMPKYNTFERINNASYNLYVKSMFKIKDSMASPKLQFLPSACVNELLQSHFGNKLFELNPKLCRTLEIEDKEINKSAKIYPPVAKISLISLIVALIISICLIITLAFTKMHIISIILFVCLYLLDIFISIIFQYKSYFDHRFLK